MLLSIPPPRRLRARRPRRAPLALAAGTQPLLGREHQFAIELFAGVLAVDEVAESTAHASLATIEPAARLAEVRHGTELAVDRPRRVPPRVELVARPLRRVLVLEARVDVSYQVCG